jgi:DNA polymerase
MGWSERQVAMLDEMGIRVWSPPEAAPPVEPVPSTRAVAAETPVPPATREAPLAVLQAEPGSRPLHLDTMGWPELREAVSGCTACKLCTGRKQTVFGVGNEREPFVGKSGQLLDNMLRAVGLTRGEAPADQQVYIANTVKCRPPGNRNPEPAELAQCEPFLIRQIALVQPRMILAMGRFAVQSLLRSTEPIGRLRGRVHQYQGVPLVVTYHPAYLLRNPEDKSRSWDDLCLAKEALQPR